MPSYWAEQYLIGVRWKSKRRWIKIAHGEAIPMHQTHFYSEGSLLVHFGTPAAFKWQAFAHHGTGVWWSSLALRQFRIRASLCDFRKVLKARVSKHLEDCLSWGIHERWAALRHLPALSAWTKIVPAMFEKLVSKVIIASSRSAEHSQSLWLLIARG